jgi:hypothetical protein
MESDAPAVGRDAITVNSKMINLDTSGRFGEFRSASPSRLLGIVVEPEADRVLCLQVRVLLVIHPSERRTLCVVPYQPPANPSTDLPRPTVLPSKSYRRRAASRMRKIALCSEAGP